MSTLTRSLEGYSRVPRHRASAATLRPERRREVMEIFNNKDPILPRGAGHSYGDAALPTTGSTIVLTERMDKLLAYNPDQRSVTSEGGVNLRDFFNVFTPKGVYLPVTPGISEISIGGCIAADIHSKNHWREGGCSRSVQSIKLLTAEAGLVTCNRTEKPDLFAATIAGYGLTGLIVEADLELKPLPSTHLLSHALPAKGTRDLFAAYVQATERHPYAVAWIDYLNGRAPRGIILSADFTDDDKKNYAPWLPTNRRPLRLIAPVFNALSQSVFNHLFYNKHKLMPESVQELRPFLFPWDNIPNFNELYGPQGFYEYQACVPEEAAERFFAELSHLLLEARSDMPVYFAAFKRMGETEGIMSYPFKGYSFLIDVKATDKAEIYLDRLDALVCDCGGRVNLAKDARLSAESCKKMYKQTDTFLSVVERFNKPALQASAMARRFGWSR